MNLEFLVFSPYYDKPICIINPITGHIDKYDVQQCYKYLLQYHKHINKHTLSCNIDSKVKHWYNRKWHIALDYYLCSPVQATDFIEKSQYNSDYKDLELNGIPISCKEVKPKLSPIQAILKRRSYRQFNNKPILWHLLSSLLHCIKGEWFPSIWQYYLIAFNITDLDPGIYKYYNTTGCLVLIKKGLFRHKVSEVLCGFSTPFTAGFTIVFAIDIEIAQAKLPYNRALREIYIDAGRLAQKLLIKGMQYGIGGVPIAMRDSLMGELLEIDLNNIMPIHTITMGLIPDNA